MNPVRETVSWPSQVLYSTSSLSVHLQNQNVPMWKKWFCKLTQEKLWPFITSTYGILMSHSLVRWELLSLYLQIKKHDESYGRACHITFNLPTTHHESWLGWYIITLCKSPKSICTYKEERILEHALRKTFILHNLSIQYSNVAFLGALQTPFTCLQENMKIWLV